MSTAKAYRLPDGDWVCELNAMAVYKGSANKADDMAKNVNRAISAGTPFVAERFEAQNGKQAWSVWSPTELLPDGAKIGAIVKSFGNQANKAADFALELNAAVRRGLPQPVSDMPAVPVPEMLKPERRPVSYGDTTVIGGTPAEREYHELTHKDRDMTGTGLPGDQ